MSLLDKIKDAANDAGIKIPEVNLSSITGKNGQNTNSTNGTNKSTSGLYDPQLEKLIDLAIADGQITEQERQVLFKKAESFGIDSDEFEMVLQAKLYERNHIPDTSSQLAHPNNASSVPTSNKYGSIRKCPACGSLIQSFSTKCPDCGYEFSHVSANHSIETLFNMLNDADMSAKLFDNTTRKKITIIENFPIPTTKEDILEFLTHSVPLSKMSFLERHDSYPNKALKIKRAWFEKSGQVIMKAKFSLSEDKELMSEISKYAKELKIKF